ncbi:hypothetical protein L6164_015300 [Bauhinia variegata]|uniref:Uncharacterized protein n=1 Tax=Bauhinia variegata TaxID=167791 RepID=A0ACB9NK79_BAUVA|nr:hypothetical protein L6164_015300 [Bauhinia variegata]
MKIQCDVCDKDEALVFCTADEAALCGGCDRRVHHANKLASKHQRFSLQRPCAKQYPLCDVCLEKRAFVFCQQDRAILCKDCDLSIHSANEHTQKHDRFLLTGIKLSAVATIYSPSASNSVITNASDSLNNPDSQSSWKNSAFPSTAFSNSPILVTKNSPTATATISATTISFPTINKAGEGLLTPEGVGSTSSISEYLIETLPGWQVEDLLDSSSVPSGLCKNDDILPFLHADIEGNLGSFSPGSDGIWVPQAPCPLYSSQMDGQIGFKISRSRLKDDNFIVPQISPPSIGSKRSRLLW